MRRLLLKCAVLAHAAGLFAFAASASAQTYPNKPIKMILGYGAGSGIDSVARTIAHRLEKTTGQPVIVDNRPGALGNIAAMVVTNSEPDGYTILFTPNSSHAANVHLFRKLPFDPVKDFTPVGPVAHLDFVLLVNPQTMPVRSVAELTAVLKKDPGKYLYGSGNATGQVLGELYKSQAGVDAVNVNYKSVPPAVTDLLGGHLHFIFADATLAIPQLKSGRVRALAVTGKNRIAALKDIPTMIESGLSNYDMSAWFGIYLPAKASPAITDYLTSHVKMAVTDPATGTFLRSIGAEPWAGSATDLARTAAADTEKWGRIIKLANIERQ
jgi:tripartite-type tricarboxylate transporter receptor subunit TctC